MKLVTSFHNLLLIFYFNFNITTTLSFELQFSHSFQKRNLKKDDLQILQKFTWENYENISSSNVTLWFVSLEAFAVNVHELQIQQNEIFTTKNIKKWNLAVTLKNWTKKLFACRSQTDIRIKIPVEKKYVRWKILFDIRHSP